MWPCLGIATKSTAAPSKRDDPGQLTTSNWILGTDSWQPTFRCAILNSQRAVTPVSTALSPNAGMAELADAADSKSAEVHPSWGFDPPSRHQVNSSRSNHFTALLQRPRARTPKPF